MMTKGQDFSVPSVIALGMFDGMHIGHRRVISKAVSMARTNGWQSVVYTFVNHPRSVFAKAPTLLMTPEERAREMYGLGVDRVDMTEFTREIAALLPDEFISLLAHKYNLAALVVGSDYTFGKNGQGNVRTLEQLSSRFGFLLSVTSVVIMDDEKVSSTRIREAFRTGQDDLARKMLGKDL